MKKILISVMMLVLCISLCTGCSSISSLGAEDGSVQKEMSKNDDLQKEIADIFEDTGLNGDYSVEDNTIIFTLDMSNFTIEENKDIDEKEEQRVVELCEKSFSNDREFDTIITELEKQYNLKNITLHIELKHKGKVLWSKDYTKKEKKNKK